MPGFALALALGLLLYPAPSAAQVHRDYPYCAYYSKDGESCGFFTLQQCRETVHGIGGFCGKNPRYRFDSPRPRRRVRRR